MGGARLAKIILGKAGYAVACIGAAVVLLVAGVGYFAQKTVGELGTSNIDTTGPSTGPMNILIMGLESRTYWNGTEIDHHLQTILHTGSAGGEQTNTLILIHIFSGGKKAVAFSIPRDDYVKLYGTLGYAGTPAMNKIDDAYNAGMQQEMINDRAQHPDWSNAQVNLDGNEAGRQATIDTVQALTGVHIDKFAELNLVGFYELAKAFGGIDVCLKGWPGGESSTGYIPKDGNLSDPVTYSPVTGWQGSDFQGKIGYQHLSPEQALAFVRDRHNVPGGDIGRTQRQQAVLDYVLWQLKHEGALADTSKLSSIMSTASGYLAVPKGWNLLEFAGELNALSGSNMTFHTLPITGTEDITAGNIGDVNTIDVAAIQKEVQTAFGETPASTTKPDTGTSTSAHATSAAPLPASSVTVNVENGGAPAGTAGKVLDALVAKGYQEGGPATDASTDQSLTTVTYGSGAAGNAAQIASDFNVTATASSSVPAGHVLVILGGATLAVPQALGGPAATPAPTSSAGASSAGSASASASSSAPDGDAITVAPNAKDGIPCVY